MAELTTRERLQPCLLDRLTDDRPRAGDEGRDARIVSVRELRRAVLRDLTWLLNSHARPPEDNLAEYPEVERSVINLGMPDLSGSTASGADPVELQRLVTEIIRRYEPRVLPHTLEVRVTQSGDRMNVNALAFEIEGEMWAQPIPEALYVKTQFDLETGQFEFKGRGDG